MEKIPPKWSLRRTVYWCFAVYIIFCVILFFIQRSLLYFPTHRLSESRLDPWISAGATVGYCREVSSPDTVWLMMHGNAGQASDRDYVLEHLSIHDALYVLEYPGYGARQGTPSKSAIDAAAQQAFSELKSLYPNVPVCAIGESIGSGPAAMLATAQQPPTKIVLITPFDTLHRVAANRFFFLPVWLLLLDRWDNAAALSDFQGKVEIYGAREDKVIPAHHASSLAEACRNASFHLIPGEHNDWSLNENVIITR